MVTQNGQILYSQPFLQLIPKQRSQPATHHLTLSLEEIKFIQPSESYILSHRRRNELAQVGRIWNFWRGITAK